MDTCTYSVVVSSCVSLYDVSRSASSVSVESDSSTDMGLLVSTERGAAAKRSH